MVVLALFVLTLTLHLSSVGLYMWICFQSLEMKTVSGEARHPYEKIRSGAGTVAKIPGLKGVGDPPPGCPYFCLQCSYKAYRPQLGYSEIARSADLHQ